MPDNDVPLKAIEEAVESLLPAAAGGDFTMQAVLKAVGAGRSQKLQERIERFLDGDGRFFSDGRGSFRLKSGFFRNFAFPVTPDAWEIENGILFPGHRFAPFVAPEIFPSEARLTAAYATEPGRHEVTAPLSQVFHYHLLLGSEQVFDFFLADSPANAGIRNSTKPTDLVTLNVFDLGAFYREHDFRKGDALLCKVLDYDAGCVEFRYLPGDERKESDLAAFVQQFDKALDQVIDRFENYLEIPEQLCWACYCGRDFLPPAEHAASCDFAVTATTRCSTGGRLKTTTNTSRSCRTGCAFPAAKPPKSPPCSGRSVRRFRRWRSTASFSTTATPANWSSRISSHGRSAGRSSTSSTKDSRRSSTTTSKTASKS